MSRRDLEAAVELAKISLRAAESALEAFNGLAENNVFETLEQASTAIEAKLERKAFEDCEGAHNCGAPEYTQEFIVGGKKYLGSLMVEYNRHDKMYYYIDSQDFEIKEI